MTLTESRPILEDGVWCLAGSGRIARPTARLARREGLRKRARRGNSQFSGNGATHQ
jgi:hypothetical protein